MEEDTRSLSANENERPEGAEAGTPVERERPVLKLRWGAEVLAGGKVCPGCKTEVAGDTVVCHRCGWNFKTGKKMRGTRPAILRERFWRRLRAWIKAGVVVGAIAAAVLWWRGHREEAESWIGMGVERVAAFAGIGQAKAREALEREKLDQELPMWRVGDQVVLEKTNGAVLEGVLTETGEGLVTVETAEGAKTVGMAQLEGRSRVRVDGLYREEVVRARSEKR